MSDSVKFVLNGFRKLSDSEKREFFDIIKDFEDRPKTTSRKIKESIGLEHISEASVLNKSNSVVFGPSPSGCACCGK
ncbi:hypothetical protein AB6D85_13155 [Vibrio splendidus]